MNEKKCNGYQSMFTFLNEEDFLKHLETCEECRQEHEKMQKLSTLIKEAKPLFKEKQKKVRMLKTVCAVFAVATLSLSYPIFEVGTDVYEKISSHQADVMTAEEMGLPVDEYGFLYIN